MPSQMSGVNCSSNRNNFNKKMNYSVNEYINGTDQYRSTDLTTMNNNVPSMNIIEQGMADLCTFSSPLNTGNMDEYRLRLGSEDLGHHRSLSSMRRASMFEGECDIGPPYLGLSRVMSENITQWNPDIFDESRLRDCCAKEAQQAGFIVGDELEVVKAKSHRSVIQNMPDRITSTFKDRYGQSDSTSKKAYLQLGVRVPTKEHVSEIVGKQGSKIKQIREKTGALITTPGEQEDHVFIIEAPPRTALHVAQILKSRAEDITMSRTQESRRRIPSIVNAAGRNNNKSPAVVGFNPHSKIILASGRIQVPKIIVGRIIGTQGSIITTIQRDTGTEIRSPPKEIGKPKHSMADFEILVYQTANITDCNEAKQRILNAKQLIAHVAMHQLEKIRAEEAPYSNYQVKGGNSLINSNGNDIHDDESNMRLNLLLDDSHSCRCGNKEQLLTQQLRPFQWIWSDVEKLDDNLAHEVVDRILEESKKKTKTRSEPSIYDNIGSNLCILGESETCSNGSADINRPRHSLPETRPGLVHGIELDSFYRSNLQSSLPYSINDSYLMPDNESDFITSPFINRREPGSRTDLSEHELLDFQSQDFIANRNFNNGNLFPGPRDIQQQTLMHQMYVNNSDLSCNAFDPHGGFRNFNHFIVEPNFQNGPVPKVDYFPPQVTSNQYYEFPVDNSHWNYSNPLTVANRQSHPETAMTKSYADSVKPTAGAMAASFSTTHGTIGDHLKKTMSSNYKS